MKTDPLQIALVAAALSVCAVQAQAEGVLAQLYAPRPPAGSSFVRIINPGQAQLQVRVAQGPVQTIGAATPATTYAIVEGGRPFAVHVGSQQAGTLSVRPDTFNTVILRQVGGKALLDVMDDPAGSQDALKAELRFYNLAADCADGRLTLGPSGPAVFPATKPGASAARSVNPVAATLSANCGGTASAPLALPVMQPGDHYSIFLTGSADAPVLRGQPSLTDNYKK
jgi:hypothetical protein